MSKEMRVTPKKRPETDYPEIAKRLRDIRIDARLTQKEMGDIVAMSSGSIGALENGLYSPNFAVIRAIHHHLGIPYETIIDGAEIDYTVKSLRMENARLKLEVEKLTKIIDKLLK